MSDRDDDRDGGDRRKASRRKSHKPFTGKDRRQGDRRSRDQLRQDYDGAVMRAKAALLAYGLDSPEFAAAARASEDLNLQIKQFDRGAGPDKGR